MSQHIVKIDGQTEALVGWDQPMLTYFAQIYKIDGQGERIAAEDGGTILQIGTRNFEIYELEEFLTKLGSRIPLDRKLRAALYADRDDGR